MNTLSSLLEFIGNEIDATRKRTVVGEIKGYAGSTAPSKWLLCDGSAVSRTTYADLFAAIGTTYGTGDGSTTFNLPDLRGRVAIGSNTTYALGSTGGEATHILTPSETAIRNHAHGSGIAGYVGGTQYGWANMSVGHNVDWAIWITGGTTEANGSAHNNMQPYLAINYIIYAGV